MVVVVGGNPTCSGAGVMPASLSSQVESFFTTVTGGESSFPGFAERGESARIAWEGEGK